MSTGSSSELSSPPPLAPMAISERPSITVCYGAPERSIRRRHNPSRILLRAPTLYTTVLRALRVRPRILKICAETVIILSRVKTYPESGFVYLSHIIIHKWDSVKFLGFFSPATRAGERVRCRRRTCAESARNGGLWRRDRGERGFRAGSAQILERGIHVAETPYCVSEFPCSSHVIQFEHCS